MKEVNEKIELALRSKFRLQEFEKLNSPKVIIDTEQIILTKRMSDLDSTELKIFHDSWDNYYLQSTIESELDNINISRDMGDYLLSLN